MHTTFKVCNRVILAHQQDKSNIERLKDAFKFFLDFSITFLRFCFVLLHSAYLGKKRNRQVPLRTNLNVLFPFANRPRFLLLVVHVTNTLWQSLKRESMEAEKNLVVLRIGRK